MQLHSSNNSILINKSNDCYYDLKVNPLFVGTNGDPGLVFINTSDTNTIAFAGNGNSVPLTANVKLNAASDNQIVVTSTGLYVAPADSYTDLDTRLAISGASPITYNSGTGVIGILIAGTATTGAITANDWNTFNNKVGNGINVGTGASVFKQKNGTNLEFRKLISAGNIQIQEIGDVIQISGTGGEYTDNDARESISATAPILYNTVTGIISITQSGTASNGYLSSSDWNSFNSRVPQTRLINTTGPLTGGGNLSSNLTLGINRGTALVAGYIHPDDFAYFSSKQDPITWEDVTAGSSKIDLNGTPTGAVKTAFSIDVVESQLNRANFTGITPITGGGTGASTATQAFLNLVPSIIGNDGKVLGTDGINVFWVTGGGGGGGENPLTFTAPLTRVGDNISIPLATGSTDGYLSSSNWNFFSNKVGGATNIGSPSGIGVFSAKVGDNLEFRKILQGTNMVVTQVGNDIILSSTAGDGTANSLVYTTAAALKANTATQIDVPYYITDAGQEGFFFYSAADSSTPDNGGAYAGTVIAAADGRRFRRRYTGAIHTTWFGLKFNDNSTSQQTINVTAINNARAAAASRQHVVTSGGAALYLNSTITIAGTNFNKREYTVFECDVFCTGTGDGFVLSNGVAPQYFEITGRLVGPNTAGNNTSESSWSSMTGRGIYMKNLYNSTVKVREVELFNVGLEMGGEANSPEVANGSQMNYVYCDWIHHCYKQISITTYGVAGTFGNWSNECFWYIGQLGRGIPGQTYGGGGWYGLWVDKAPGASGVSNPQPYYGINGHIFHNCVFEGLDTYIKSGFSGNFNFIGCGFEPDGAHTHFDLDPVETKWWKFTGGTAVRDSRFAPGRKGFKTFFEATPFYGAIGGDTSSQFIGMSATSIPSSPAMTGFTHSANGNFIIHQDSYPGPSALDGNDDGTHVLTSKLAQYPGVQNGIVKFDGFRRHGAYKRTFLDSSNNTTPVACQPNLGYVRVQATVTVNPKVFQVYAGDLVNTAASTAPNFEHFYVEKLNSTPIQFVRSDTGATLIPSTSFPDVGLYLCIWRASGYTTFRIDGGGGTGTGNVISVESTSADNQLILFNSVGDGKTVKKSTGTGYVKLASGIASYIPKIPIADIDATGTPSSTTALFGDGTWKSIGSSGVYSFSTGLSESSGVVTNNLSTGIAGNQIVTGSISSGGQLILRSTTHATKGQIVSQDTIILRANTRSQNTAPIKFSAPSTTLPNMMDIHEVGAMEFDGTDLWFTTQADGRQKLIRATTNAILTNVTYNGAPVTYNYGGRDSWEDGVPTFTAGTGAGTSPTITFPSSNRNGWGRITVTAGSSPAASSPVITVNFSTSIANAVIVFSPANSSAAARNTATWIEPVGNTGFLIHVGTALSAGSTYTWHYHVKRTQVVT